MVPFAAKFGWTEGEPTEPDLDLVATEYARYFGHDPDGNWILVVNADNSSEVFRFDNLDDMWCCRPDREKYYQRQHTDVVPAFERISSAEAKPSGA
jgi:hypothetical protein